MASASVTLRPVYGSAEEVERTRRQHRDLAVSGHGMFLLLGGISSLTVAMALYLGAWEFVPALVIPAVLIYQLWRRHVMLSQELVQVTTTYRLTESSLEKVVSYNGGKVREESTTYWRDVSTVEDTDSGVKVHYLNGTSDLLPNECFESPDQRALVASYWREGRWLTRLILGIKRGR